MRRILWTRRIYGESSRGLIFILKWIIIKITKTAKIAKNAEMVIGGDYFE